MRVRLEQDGSKYEGRLTFTATAVTGQVVTRRTGAAIAAGGVDAGVQAQPPGLAVVEQLALVDI